MISASCIFARSKDAMGDRQFDFISVSIFAKDRFQIGSLLCIPMFINKLFKMAEKERFIMILTKNIPE